jgi:hypothetical protein
MNTPHSQKVFGVFILLFTIIFTGCNSTTSQPTPYIPPNSNVTIPPLPSSTYTIIELQSETSQPLSPFQTENCSDYLLYIDDITIPDWTTIKPGTEVDKQWDVENTGSCNWDHRYSLRLTSGEGMGAVELQDLYPARAGLHAIIQIKFISPLQGGTYQGVWQAHNPLGQPFGDPISILIVVEP